MADRVFRWQRFMAVLLDVWVRGPRSGDAAREPVSRSPALLAWGDIPNRRRRFRAPRPFWFPAPTMGTRGAASAGLCVTNISQIPGTQLLVGSLCPDALRRCRRTYRPGWQRCRPTAGALSARAARAPR